MTLIFFFGVVGTEWSDSNETSDDFCFFFFFRSATDTVVGEDDLLFTGIFFGEVVHDTDFFFFGKRLFVMISNFAYVVKCDNLLWVR